MTEKALEHGNFEEMEFESAKGRLVTNRFFKLRKLRSETAGPNGFLSRSHFVTLDLVDFHQIGNSA